MIPLAKKASPAAISVLKQATAIWTKRSTASDGLLPSPAHVQQNPNSDHNSGLAVDLTHDPAHGVDCAVLFEHLKEDPRVEYLIHNRKIWSRDKWKAGNRPYTGSNPHQKHLHISIIADKANDTSPWFWWVNQPTILGQIKAAMQPQPAKKVNLPIACGHCAVHCPSTTKGK